MTQFTKNTNKIVHFYCELFGKDIQGRIDYGNKKYIRIIGLRIADEIKSPAFLYKMLDEYNLSHICVPVLGIAHGLQEALEYTEIYVNKIYPDGNSFEEGIVIKPLNRVYITNNGDIFFLKKKNPKFNERTTKNKKENVISDECSALIEQFFEYINESRMFSVFSKEGRSINSNSEIGFFVKKILEDAKEDFIKDTGQYNIECEKKMFSFASKIIASLLMNKMKQE